jgi:PhnB protein
MGTDVLKSLSQKVTVGSNVYVVLETDSEEEAETLFDALASGGKVEMPLQKTEWAEKYGVLADRFGVQWMLSYTGNVQFSFGNGQSGEAVDPAASG